MRRYLPTQRFRATVIAPSLWGILLLGACEIAPSQSENEPDPVTAIRFVRDASSCVGGAQLELAIDGAIRDTVALFPGEQSPSYPVQPGNHEVVARRLFVTSGLAQWGPSLIAVAEGETRAFVMDCPD